MKPILSPKRFRNSKKDLSFKLPSIGQKGKKRGKSFEDPTPIRNCLEVSSFVESFSESVVSLISIPENPNHIGLGATLWLHKFVYNTRKRSVKTIEGFDEHGNSQKKLIENGDSTLSVEILGKRGFHQRRASWSNLRTRLANSKISDGLLNQRFHINGKTYTVLRLLGEGGYSKVLQKQMRQFFYFVVLPGLRSV